MVIRKWNGFNRYTGELYTPTFYVSEEWWMVHPKGGYYRRIRTKQECKRYIQDLNDEYTKLYNIKLRHSRNNGYLNAWNIEKTATCYTTKSWKKLYKCGKSYGKNRKVLTTFWKNETLEYIDE